jgi:hypothetical protein
LGASLHDRKKRRGNKQFFWPVWMDDLEGFQASIERMKTTRGENVLTERVRHQAYSLV